MTGKVTAVKVQKRRRDRVSVFLDGEYAFALQGAVAAELRVGQDLTDREIEALQRRDAAEVGHERALHYLSFRPRSEWEMRRYLQRKGLDDDGIDSVLSRLRQARLIGDQDFARFWVENRGAFSPRGPWALRGELRRKGIDRSIIDSVLGDVDEEAGAMQVAERAARRLASLDEQAFRRRLLGRLQRRGFSYDVSRRICDRLWRQVGAQGDMNPLERAWPDDQ
jgi:regulatory protein